MKSRKRIEISKSKLKVKLPNIRGYSLQNLTTKKKDPMLSVYIDLQGQLLDKNPNVSSKNSLYDIYKCISPRFLEANSIKTYEETVEQDHEKIIQEQQKKYKIVNDNKQSKKSIRTLSTEKFNNLRRSSQKALRSYIKTEKSSAKNTQNLSGYLKNHRESINLGWINPRRSIAKLETKTHFLSDIRKIIIQKLSNINGSLV